MSDQKSEYRIERDSMGELKVPANALYGAQTQRAVQNFPISGRPMPRGFIRALGLIKAAAADVNAELGLLPKRQARAIRTAALSVAAGAHDTDFPIDIFQTGSGTSSNMNANEVICNRALELLGQKKGEYQHLHPLDHVNLSQSTNDVYPTAIKLALHFGINRLLVDMATLRKAFDAKAKEFSEVLKVGRTQLQDAVPMTLGQEFSTYAVMLGEDELRLAEAASLTREINLGATAIGTGINAHPDYARRVTLRLSEIANAPFVVSPNLVEATQDAGSFVQLSGVLKRIAVKLSKICNDLRLLSSGPRAGIGEITLPTVQAGSSIMPGKVNPVIPEVVNQIAFEVIGNDITVTMAAEAGQLQLNAFEPIIAHSLFKSLQHLGAGCRTLAERCVSGITANVERARRLLDESTALVTALTPYIGYARSTEIAQEALRTGAMVYDLVLQKKLMTREQLEQILRPEVLTKPHYSTVHKPISEP
jgi:aspartate ammonia-lyase